MHYTIASIEDLVQETRLDFMSVGNTYVLSLHKDGEQQVHRTFYEHSEASAMFLKLTGHIIGCEYSYKSRVSILKGENHE
jgi:hypothetical protein